MKTIEIFDRGDYNEIKIVPDISVEEYKIICSFLGKTLHKRSHKPYLKNLYTRSDTTWQMPENVAFWKEAIPFLEALGYKVVQK